MKTRCQIQITCQTIIFLLGVRCSSGNATLAIECLEAIPVGDMRR
jgi:hypothetical protein